MPRSRDPAGGVRPGKERQNRTGCPILVTEVEVIGAGVVEIHGELDEPQAENRGVEVEIPLWITGNHGDVMDSGDRWCRHRLCFQPSYGRVDRGSSVMS